MIALGVAAGAFGKTHLEPRTLSVNVDVSEALCGLRVFRPVYWTSPHFTFDSVSANQTP